jgi:IMP dehydrogenase
MKIKELVKNKGFEVIAVDGGTKLGDAIKKMIDRNIGAILVVEESKPAGIFTERDVLKQWGSATDPNVVPIRDVMTTNLIIVDVDDELEYAMSIMIQKGVRHMPVVEKGKLVSVLSMRDVVKAQVKNLEAEVHYLKDFISDIG